MTQKQSQAKLLWWSKRTAEQRKKHTETAIKVRFLNTTKADRIAHSKRMHEARWGKSKLKLIK